MERIRARDNWLIAEEDTKQRKAARDRAIHNGRLGDRAFNLVANKITSLAEVNPESLSMKDTFELAKMARDLHREHRDMFALTAQEQARDDIDNARIDLEFDKLEASKPAPATEESGSNFIEALNANAADFFPNAADMLPQTEGGDAEHGEDDGTAEH